jgi:hypothetical protein
MLYNSGYVATGSIRGNWDARRLVSIDRDECAFEALVTPVPRYSQISLVLLAESPQHITK